jgi:hypothetical protein
MSDDSKARRIGFPVGATILIVLGIVFLLNNLGYLPWGIWGALWRFWPVLLILIGVNFFLAGSRPWLMLLVTLVVLGGVFVAAWMMGGVSPTPASSIPGAAFSQPLGNAQRAVVEIDFGAGKLSINSLQQGSDRLASGQASEGAVREASTSNGTARLRMTTPATAGCGPGVPSVDWSVQLTGMIPVDLSLKTGANEANINLTDLIVPSFTLETGASQNVLVMPANSGTTNAVIKAGAASIKVTVPSGVAARIKAETGVSSVDIDQVRFPRSGNYYASPDYAIAPNRVDIEIKAGAASISVR